MPKSLPLNVHDEPQSDVSTSSINDVEGKSKRKNSFAGADALTADNDARIRAYWMEQEGKKEKEIFQETGWFRGADGKWRFEIDDSEAKVFYKGDIQLLQDPDYVEYQELFDDIANWGDDDKVKIKRFLELEKIYKDIKKIKTVRDYLEHPGLYKAYPFIANIGIEKKK